MRGNHLARMKLLTLLRYIAEIPFVANPLSFVILSEAKNLSPRVDSAK